MTKTLFALMALVLSQTAAPKVEDLAQTLLQALAQDAGLAEAVRAVHPHAKRWTVRESDSNWLVEGADQVVWVDFPAVDISGRVGWHRSSFCTRTRGEGTWKCSRRGKKSLLEVRSPGSRAVESGACPAGAVRGIRVGPRVPLEIVAELTDYVRLGSAGPSAIDAMCRPSLAHWKYPVLEFCDVASIQRGGDATFSLALRIASAHMLVLELEHACDAGECQTRLIDCGDIIA